MDVQRAAHDGERYDAVIVGARIAGTATALGLARRGARVLLLDADTFPSDTLSTHLLWSDALQCLDRLGVLAEVRATDAPPIEHFQINYGPYTNTATIPTRRNYPPLLSVRRLVLDDILLRRARVTTNITIREGIAVTSLLRDGDAVVGVHGTARDTSEKIIAHGRITIGADGRRSTVAREVGAAGYDVVAPLLATYYRYYRGVQPLAAATLEAFRDAHGGFCYLFPCDDQLWTLAVSFPQAQFDRVRRNHEAALAAQVADKEGLIERLAGAEAVSPWRGAGDLQNFFRVPYGQGWALVGDAGYHRDPITGRGIADALRSAELLCAALTGVWRSRTTHDAALAAYQQARDALVRPLYDFTVERPPADVTPGDWSGALARTISDPDYLSTYVGFMANVTPAEAFYSAAAVYAPVVG